MLYIKLFIEREKNIGQSAPECPFKLSGLVLGRRPLGAILHSSNETGELSQWLCHDDSTINIVVLIIIIPVWWQAVFGFPATTACCGLRWPQEVMLEATTLKETIPRLFEPLTRIQWRRKWWQCIDERRILQNFHHLVISFVLRQRQFLHNQSTPLSFDERHKIPNN